MTYQEMVKKKNELENEVLPFVCLVDCRPAFKKNSPKDIRSKYKMMVKINRLIRYAEAFPEIKNFTIDSCNLGFIETTIDQMKFCG